MALSDVDELQKELKSDTLHEMFTQGDTFTNRILAAAQQVEGNNRAYLIPRWTSMGGDFRGVTFDGDALANGTGPFTDQPSLSAIGFACSFSATQLTMMAARNSKVAVAPFMAKWDAMMMRSVKMQMECMLNAGSNDGILAILSGEAGTVYTMDSVDDRYGGYLLNDGATYQIIASAAFPATIRANGPYRVLPDGSGLNKRANPATVQFAQANGTVAAAITGWAAEDRVVAFNLANASLASIGHLVSHLTTGTVQGVSRAIPHNRPTRIDGGASPLDAALVRRLYADIFKYSGMENGSEGLIPYGSQESIVNWLNSAQAVSAIRLTDADGAGIGEIYDRYIGDMKINKKKPLISNRANPQQFRFIRPADFIWYTMQKLKFLPNDGGGRLHFQHNASGDLLTAYSVHVIGDMQLGCENMKNMGVVYNLAKPALGS